MKTELKQLKRSGDKEVETKSKEKHAGGRPLKFTPEFIASTFMLYKMTCRDSKKIINKAGLLREIGMSRETYREYKAKKEYVDTIKEIESEIEDAWIQQLTKSGVATGAIFYLKNAFKEEYKDRQETDITSNGETLHIYMPQRK